jgi:hypothetical protein
MMTAEKWIDLDDIALWDANPNIGDLGATYNSIKRFGFYGYAVLWRGVCKGGNHSVKALRWLRRDGDWTPTGDGIRVVDGAWQVRYFDISHMDEATSNAFALALNRTARLGHDDPAMLLTLLQEIEQGSEELREAAGYDTDDVDELLYLVNLNNEGREDNPPEEFPSYDEEIETEYCCPRCNYRWSGKPNADKGGDDDDDAV